MKLIDFIKFIEKTAPLSLAAPWDHSGIQVAAPSYDVQHVAVMLDPTPAGVGAALAYGANFILAHHPLALKPRFVDATDDYYHILKLLLPANICLYSAHTSLDANPRGPVTWLGQALQLQQMRVLEQVPVTGWTEAGFGFVGTLPSPVSYADFCHTLAQLTGKTAWRSCGTQPETVSTVACCPGSGADMIPLAGSCSADVFITGDVKYHPALESPIRVIDIGHFQLEEIMMRHFSEQLAKEVNGVQVSFIPSADPFVFERVSDICPE